MNEAADFAVSAVILPALRKVEGSDRGLPAVAGEPKDLYLTRHARLPNESGSCVLASLPCSCPTMSAPPISAVILSERSESKDLYVMQHARMHAEAEFAQAVDPMVVLRHEQQSEEGQNDHSAQACL